jgi:DNA-binding PucR family transcriptional regulator
VAFPAEDAEQHRVMAALRTRRTGRTGVSGPVRGLAEAARAVRQAALTRRTLGPDAGVAALDERLPEVLLLQAPEVSERLVSRWLGPLLDLPPAEREPLVDTLDAWVRSSGSAGQTAAAVRCHRNTVLNRLRRLQELIDPPGHDLTEGSVPLELSLALCAHRLAR